MLQYAYLYKHPKQNQKPEPGAPVVDSDYVVYAASREEADKKFEEENGVPGIFIRRETW